MNNDAISQMQVDWGYKKWEHAPEPTYTYSPEFFVETGDYNLNLTAQAPGGSTNSLSANFTIDSIRKVTTINTVQYGTGSPALTNFDVIYQGGKWNFNLDVESTGDDYSTVSGTVVTPDGTSRSMTFSHMQILVDVPYIEQYVVYMEHMLKFDLGSSFKTGQPVWDEVSKRAPRTMLLFGVSLIMAPNKPNK